MRQLSAYIIECVCGARIEQHEPSGVCECGREFRVKWPAELPPSEK